MLNDLSNTAHLLISCPDRSGIVAAVSQFLYAHGANVLDASQHTTDPVNGTFFMRMVFHIEGLDVTKAQFERSFGHVVGTPFSMDWHIAYSDQRKKMALMVSKYDHCFMELLWRWQRNELRVDIPLVISNHENMRSVAESYGLRYECIAVNKENKAEQEEKTIALLKEHDTDFIVLARYMQILSPDFVAHFPQRIINIHHSFLPAFVGANPYLRAYERGVKLIGATAHYVTNDLDEGPIIEQDVQRISHRESVEDMMQIGRDIERHVLAKAVQAHVQDRILVFANKTVIF
jgi:formyltetrahydrofolate deformylase